MDRIYQDAKDKNVAAVIVYANGANKIFYDKAFKNAVANEDGLELFSKGVICLKGTTYYNAKTCTADGVIDFGLV